MDQSGGKCRGMLSKTAVAKMFPIGQNRGCATAIALFVLPSTSFQLVRSACFVGRIPGDRDPGDVSKVLVVLHKI
jgi:hypothetical protein